MSLATIRARLEAIQKHSQTNCKAWLSFSDNAPTDLSALLDVAEAEAQTHGTAYGCEPGGHRDCAICAALKRLEDLP